MSEWAELWEDWEALRGELEEATRNLPGRERGLILGFYEEVERGALKPLQELEDTIERGASNPPALADRFKRILSGFYALASAGPSVTSGVPVYLLNRVWHQGIEAITSFLERKARTVGVESWSIGATVGFPTGVSGTVMVNFRREKAL